MLPDRAGAKLLGLRRAELGMTGAMTALELLAAFVLIILGAIAFTNAVEWLGQRLNLGEGAVGALLAAVGTALPESVIPIVALVGGGGPEATEIAIGAIIGAPFLLGTLAMVLVVGSAHLFKARRDHGAEVVGEPAATRRDLKWFLMLISVAIVLGVIGAPRMRSATPGRSTAATPRISASGHCSHCCRCGWPARRASGRLADGDDRPAGEDVLDELLGALLGPAVAGDEVVGERVDVLERGSGLVETGGEDERVGGVADALQLRRLQLGRTEILQRLDDPAVGLCAF